MKRFGKISLFILILFPFFIFCDLRTAKTSLFDVKRTRPIAIEIWEQESPVETKRPLLIFSHGSRGDPKDHNWFFERMAREGFIVVSVEHFGNCKKNCHPVFFMKVWDRPLDIHMVIDHLLADGKLSKRIDSAKIAFCGYSLGGMTGIWIAGGRLMHLKEAAKLFSTKGLPKGLGEHLIERIDLQECMANYRDKRIKAVVAFAPAAWGFSKESLQKVDTPVLIIAPKEDEVLPISSNAEYLSQHIPKARLDVVEGKGGHRIFLNEEGALLDSYRTEVHERTFQLTLQFLKEKLSLEKN